MKNIKKEKLLIATMIIALIAILPTISKAGMQINGGTPWTSITVSESYQECQNLKNSDSTLGSNSLDPHLTLNRDWGTVAYLALSQYGAVATTTGPSITVDGTSRYTTTGNATGVLDFGKNYTQTSSLLGGANTNTHRTILENNIDTKYVETLGATASDESNKGMAYGETSGWYGSVTDYATKGDPVGIRKNIAGFDDHDGYNYYGGGWANSNASFRPVVWN